MLMETGDHFCIVSGPFVAGGGDAEGREIEGEGGVQAVGVGDVGEDDGDFDAGEAMLADGGGDGQEVGASAGEEDAQALH